MYSQMISSKQKYSVADHQIHNILSWVSSNEIAIPEIQRPFVWNKTKVRDLIDSLYQGYPVGYIIVWKNPNTKLKDGTMSTGKKILIDGQQRITALTAAILGKEIINKEYDKEKIQIAFNPIEEKFEVLNPAISKDDRWIPDISILFNKSNHKNCLALYKEYLEKNSDVDSDLLFENISKLEKLTDKQIGYIELSSELDIETVTEIFIRINSKGAILNQADFVMSKIASWGEFGSNLRKCIDYFCHLAVEPDFYNKLYEIDEGFKKTEYLQKIAWLKDDKDDLYDPDYTDLLRVSFTYGFERGRLQDLVSLLSGRDFEERVYKEEIVKQTFEKLDESIKKFINKTNFERFVMIIKSAGFIDKKLITSKNTLNFAYILYLKLREQNYNQGLIESIIRRWFVMSVLTGRYSSSPESAFDYDIKQITSKGAEEYLKTIEDGELSSSFWQIRLVSELEKANINNPLINTFFAAQIKSIDKGFLSKDITINDLISHSGDIHHIFPKDFLKKKFKSRTEYNQIANFAYTQQEINIKIGNKSPKEYFTELFQQCNGGDLKYGSICDEELLKENLRQNCIPDGIINMDIDSYPEFLLQRRKLMSEKIEQYYKSL